MVPTTQWLKLIEQTQHIEQSHPPRSPKESLPTMHDLPSEDAEESGLPDEFHDLQPQLLSRTLSLTGYSQENYFTASDLNLYYQVRHPLWYKRPDWFLVVGVPRLYEQRELRRSYVLWQEAKPPDVIIELLSPGTEAEDLGRFYNPAAEHGRDELIASASHPDALGTEAEVEQAKPPTKFEVYETYLRVPHYFVFSRYTQQLRYFKLEGGRYQEQSLNSECPLVWLADLEIGLGIWQGEFAGVTAAWLRWCDAAGNWLLTDTEQAQQQLAQVQTQLLQAAQNLLATGMSLEQVTQMLNLSTVQVEALRSR